MLWVLGVLGCSCWRCWGAVAGGVGVLLLGVSLLWVLGVLGRCWGCCQWGCWCVRVLLLGVLGVSSGCCCWGCCQWGCWCWGVVAGGVGCCWGWQRRVVEVPGVAVPVPGRAVTAATRGHLSAPRSPLPPQPRAGGAHGDGPDPLGNGAGARGSTQPAGLRGSRSCKGAGLIGEQVL